MKPELYYNSRGISLGIVIPLFALLRRSMHIKNYDLENVSS